MGGYSHYCQLVLRGYSQYSQVLSSCVGVLPSIVSTRSCRQNTEERSAETRQTQTVAKTETKIKTNTKTMTRTKIKTETKTDTRRSTGTRGGRSLSTGQGLCEFGRNLVCGHKIVQDWYIIVCYAMFAHMERHWQVLLCIAMQEIVFIMAGYLNMYTWIRR